MVSHHAAEPRGDIHSPSYGNLVIEASGQHAQPIPLMRRGIFFYDLSDHVLPSVVGDLHHAHHQTSGQRSSRPTLQQPMFSTLRMKRPAIIPAGSWPRRMPAEIAAGYCGEPTVEAFLKRVGSEYPQPRIKEGRRKLWLRDDLDRAIAPDIVPGDLAEDL
jgi:hypothetical protein